MKCGAEYLRHRRERRLWPALSIDKSERPVADGRTAAPPVVGPAEHHRAARALAEGDPYLHRGQRCLLLRTKALTVGPALRQKKGFVSREVLKPRRVGAHGFRIV